MRSLRVAVFFVALLLLWEWFVSLEVLPAYILPAPSEIALTLAKDYPLLLQNSYATLLETLVGFAAAVVVGVFLAVLMVYSDFLRSVLYPILITIRSVPIVAIAPILIVWFGFGLMSKLVLAFLISFFPITVNTISGMTDIDPGKMEMASALTQNRNRIFWKLRLPHSLPYLFDGLKISLPLALIGAIIGEFVGANTGLGNLILVAGSVMKTPLMFATLVVIAVISLVLFGLIVWADKRVAWWRSLQ
ncbi:MAG: ABC transporter permease [Candidatus Tectomicrobia bacterium]|nr:ABC transporter permease [Candidatus Tectomicrobia bacterium]